MYGENPWNPSKYTVTDAPTRVRRRWARKGVKTRLRNLLASCRANLREISEIAVEAAPMNERLRSFGKRYAKHRPMTSTERVRSRRKAEGRYARKADLTPAQERWERIRSGRDVRALDIPSFDEEAFAKGYDVLGGKTTAANPELLIVKNPGRRGSMRRRRRRNVRRSRRRNKPLTVRYKGASRTWKSLVKRLGVMGAKRVWRKARKRHGYGKAGYVYRRRKRARRANPRRRRRRRSACRYIRIGGRRKSWRGLVRKHGVKKASRIWRKHRKVARNKGRGRRTRRRRRRNF